MSELRPQCEDGRLEVVIRVVPLAKGQAEELRTRQLAAIVTLLRRAAAQPPAPAPLEEEQQAKPETAAT